MTLVRELFFISTKHNISVTFIHIPEKQNIYADLLSRLQVESFRSICPDCFPLPSTIPQQILDVLDRIQQTIYASLSPSLQLQLQVWPESIYQILPPHQHDSVPANRREAVPLRYTLSQSRADSKIHQSLPPRSNTSKHAHWRSHQLAFP